MSGVGTHCHAQAVWSEADAIIVYGDKATINDALKSASRDTRTPGAAALLTKNYASMETAVDLGALDTAGFRIINRLKADDKGQFYRFAVKAPGSITMSVSKNASNFEYGIREVGGAYVATQYAAVGGDLNQFFLPGEYVVFVSRLDWNTTYQLNLKFNPE